MFQVIRGFLWFTAAMTAVILMLESSRLVLFVLQIMPSLRRKLLLKINKDIYRNITAQPKDWEHLHGTWLNVKQMAEILWTMAFTKQVGVGDRVPEIELNHLQRSGEAITCRLLDFAKAGRPLVINFGSCT